MRRQRVVDVVSDVLTDFDSRRGRTVLLVLAVVLSTGALVTSVGIGATASRQIAADLAATMLDEVSLSASPGAHEHAGPLLPTDAEERAAAIPLVTAVGTRLDLEAGALRPRRTAHSPVATNVRVVAATSGYLDIAGVRAHQDVAWMFDPSSRYDVVVLGRRAAQALAVPTGASAGYQVYLGDRAFDVVGVLDDGTPDLDDVVVVPYSVGVGEAGEDITARLVVTTEPGAGASVVAVLPQAVRPDQPTILTTSRVADLLDLRRGVDSQLGQLIGAVGTLLLALTGLLIANAMVVSVVSRTPEIGLRRALGASRSLIVTLFLAEGALVGALGGIGGTAAAAWAIVAVSAVNSWTAVLPPMLFIAGPVVGLTVGVVASIYPAARAARISPAVAVRME